ncbi:MAG: putative primase/helicase, partial [Frankiaceae bacterium]|nr:putative primase/helicase [Frankiaceae bacterium]
VEETGDGHRLDTVKLKRYLGTEAITGRRMRQDPISFRPTHTLVITTNNRPVVVEDDHGTWRRLRMIPFPKTFGAEGQTVDRGLRSRLIEGPQQREAVLDLTRFRGHRLVDRSQLGTAVSNSSMVIGWSHSGHWPPVPMRRQGRLQSSHHWTPA